MDIWCVENFIGHFIHFSIFHKHRVLVAIEISVLTHRDKPVRNKILLLIIFPLIGNCLFLSLSILRIEILEQRRLNNWLSLLLLLQDHLAEAIRVIHLIAGQIKFLRVFFTKALIMQKA